MGVDVECKREGSSEESSSSVDAASNTPSNAPSTAATTDDTTIAGQDSVHQQKSPPRDTVDSTIASGRSDDTSSLQPASKRIKLENEATTTAACQDSAGAGSGTDTGICEVPTPIATSASIPIASPSAGMTQHATSALASCDNVATSATANMETSSAAKPQHPVIPTDIDGQEHQPSQAIPAISTSTTATGSTKESSSSSNSSQAGSSSVVTASIGSSPQHTSQSSNTSADSSNESLNDCEENSPIATSTTATTTTTSLPSAKRGQVQSAVARPNVTAARTLISNPPPIQASTTTAATPKHLPLATTKSTSGRSVLPPSKQVPVRPQVPPPSAASSTTVPVSSASTNATTLNKEVPLKALNFGHLRIKYLGELEYMLLEFRKLERQLLGAKGAQQLEESLGSRERREKLHSFILHLEDTIRQIEMGCKLEVEGQCNTIENRNDAAGAMTNTDGNPSATSTAGDKTSSTCDTAAEEAKNKLAQESALSNLTKEKEEEETVQKLEEHILANLLPVKVRLKKQLAAQQGATQNPPGMPVRRGTLQPSSTTRGKGTFVEAAEKKRKHAESLRLAAQAQHERQVRSVSDPTQFGKPLSGVGSSLTKKLHGSTLGSKNRRGGHGVGSAAIPKETPERKILHAGMVPKSTQQKSGLSAAEGAHEIVKTSNQNNNNSIHKPATAALAASVSGKSTPTQSLQASTNLSASAVKPKRTVIAKMEPKGCGAATTIVSDAAKQNKAVVASSSAPLSEEDKLKFKKHRRLRKLKRLKRRRERELARQQLSKSQQQLQSNAQSATNPAMGRKKAGHAKVGQKKKGPRVVEYTCSQCSETYTSTCDLNPWWALAQHKCPKCQKTQIPRIDITSPANTIDYHPALLSHLEDSGRGGGSIAANSAQAVAPSMPIVSQVPDGANSVNSESDSDLSELSDDNISIGSLRAAALESELQSMTPVERAEHETFGKEYEGPVLSDDHAAKLLILMGHASTCPCQHKLEKHKDVCRSVKYMMLHVRDCPGTTSTCDVCPFPWCRKVKHLLYHLVSCKEPDQCVICSPKDLPKGLKGLVGLNAHRTKKHRERLIAIAKASVAKGAKANPATKKQATTKKSAPVTQATKPPAAQAISAVQRPVSEPAPVKQQKDTKPAPAPFIATTTIVALTDAGDSNGNHVVNPLTTPAHPAVADPPTETPATSSDLDFDINAEIAKLDEQLGSDVPGDTQTCTIVPIKQELGTGSTVAIADANVEANGVAPMDYTTTISATEVTNENVLPTPVDSIKMEDHDADAAELNDLLATTSSTEDISNPLAEGDVGDVSVSDYLKAEFPQDSAVRATEHQQQIDNDGGVPGVDALNDPNSDPLANINHVLFLEPSEVPHTALVPAPSPTNACVEEYPEASIEPTPDVSTVAASATDVEKTAGSVTVN